MALDKAVLAQLGLNEFTVIDLETTGLDPPQAEILEFGAVRFLEGAPVEGVSQLLRPRRPLSEFITALTGITPEDVAFAPEAESALPELLARWTRGTLVAHNADFELKFLNQAAQTLELKPIVAERCLDTLTLARAVLPTLYNHKLETLVQHLKLASDSAHRAREDAEATGWLLLELVERALGYEAHVLDWLARLAPDGALQALLKALAERVARRARAQPDLYEKLPQPHWTPLAFDLEPLQPLNLDQVEEAFSPSGPLGRALAQFESRPEQQQLARAVSETFNAGGFLVAEAGTGVGKSFAYLVPALMWSALNDGPAGRVVLSTHTKTLQDQLFRKDIPRVSQAFGRPWRAVLLKGRQNYACLRRLDALLRGPLSVSERAALMPLIPWLDRTQTGDLEEVPSLPFEVRRRVYDDPEYCVGRRCAFYERCFSINARQAAKRAQLVVVNHALLLADLVQERSILGEYQHLIVDEAHHLERATRRALQRRASFWDFAALFDELLRQDDQGREVGLLKALERASADAPKGEATSDWPAVVEGVYALKQRARAWFEELTRHVQAASGKERPEYSLKRRYTAETFAAWQEPLALFDQDLQAFSERLLALVQARERASESAEEALCDAIQAVARNLAALSEGWRWLVEAEQTDHVFWVELATRENSLVVFNAMPLDVGEPLDALYEELRSAVFTSATLSVAGDFSYFRSRVGLERLPAAAVRAQDFGQPFDHHAAVHLCVPDFLPLPHDAKFPAALAELLFELASYTQRRTLALFTSYKLLQDVQERLKGRELVVLAQGPGQPRTKVLEEFRHGPRAALLLGTDSFWEGIDLPGETLEIVVVTKLPFPVPSDPLVAAEEERLRQLGESAFSHYSLPQAILTLRQGFGRLLRARTDRGAVVLADTRVVRKGYGKRFLEALPCPAHTYLTPSSLLTELKRFFSQGS